MLWRNSTIKRLFVDANILVRIVVGKEYGLLKHLIGTEPYTSATVLEEAAYKIIALSILEVEGGKPGPYRIRKLFEKGVADDTIKARLAGLNMLVEKINIIASTREDFEQSKEIIDKYRLLPNDALIVAMMRRRGISELLTLDSDFKRIPWLNIIP